MAEDKDSLEQTPLPPKTSELINKINRSSSSFSFHDPRAGDLETEGHLSDQERINMTKVLYANVARHLLNLGDTDEQVAAVLKPIIEPYVGKNDEQEKIS